MLIEFWVVKDDEIVGLRNNKSRRFKIRKGENEDDDAWQRVLSQEYGD